MIHTSQRGFSALELIGVVVVIGIVTAVAIPNVVTARRSYTLRVAATALEQQLNRCRQEAVRANLPIKIKATGRTTRIDVNRDNAFDAGDGSAITIGDEATITASTPTDGIVTFTSRGEMLLGQTPSFTVTLDSISRIVSIDPRGAVIVAPEVSAH